MLFTRRCTYIIQLTAIRSTTQASLLLHRANMPPKRKTSSVKKRKAPSDDVSLADEAEASSQPSVKRSKSDTIVQDTAADRDTRYSNKILPTAINFTPKTEGCWRIASWNVSGLAAAQKKGFNYYVAAENPDILILTETKMNNEPADPSLVSRYAYRYWSIADKKGYAGTAILSKHKPLSVDMTLPGHPDSSIVKGRIISLEYEKFFLVGTYVVNAGQDLKTLNKKNEWNEHFEVYIRDLESKKPVIWAGDLNVAPTALDLSNAKKNWNKSAGYTEAETTAFARILNSTQAPDEANTKDGNEANGELTTSRSPSSTPRFIDVWRDLHPYDRQYTYFGYRFNCRAKGIGWRIDMFVLSEKLVPKVKLCEIRSEIYGASDHCPIVLEINNVE